MPPPHPKCIPAYHKDTFIYVNFSYVNYVGLVISAYICTAELSTRIIKYRRSGNFRVKNILCVKISWL